MGYRRSPRKSPQRSCSPPRAHPEGAPLRCNPSGRDILRKTASARSPSPPRQTPRERVWQKQRRTALLSAYSRHPILKIPEKHARWEMHARGVQTALELGIMPLGVRGGWNFNTRVNLPAGHRPITRGEDRPTYGRPTTAPVPVYEVIATALAHGPKAIREYKRDYDQFKESNDFIVRSLPGSRQGARQAADTSLLPAFARRRAPIISCHPDLRAEDAPLVWPPSQHQQIKYASRPEVPISLDTIRPWQNFHINICNAPFSDEEELEEDEATQAETEDGSERAMEEMQELARRDSVRQHQREAVMHLLGKSHALPAVGLGPGEQVPGDGVVVDVIRQVLQTLYDGFKSGVDVYVALIEPGFKKMTYIGKKAGDTVDGKKIMRGEGVSWGVADRAKSVQVPRVQEREGMRFLGATAEHATTATGTYLAAPIRSVGVSGVLGLIAVDNVSFGPGAAGGWRLGRSDLHTLVEVGEALGEWLDARRKAQVLHDVKLALLWGIVDRKGMYDAVVQGLRSVVVDAIMFVATAVNSVVPHSPQAHLMLACATNGASTSSCSMFASETAKMGLKGHGVVEMRAGKGAAAACVDTSKRAHTLISMLKPKGCFHQGDTTFLQALADLMSGSSGLQATYERAVAGELAQCAMQWVELRTGEQVAGAFATLQESGITAQYVTARGNHAAPIGELVVVDGGINDESKESDIAKAINSHTPIVSDSKITMPAVTARRHIGVGALEVSARSINNIYSREQLGMAVEVLADAIASSNTTGAAWQLRNDEIGFGIDPAVPPCKLLFYYRLLKQVRARVRLGLREESPTIKGYAKPPHELEMIVHALTTLDLGMEPGKPWSSYRTSLTNSFWVDRAIAFDPLASSDESFAAAHQLISHLHAEEVEARGCVTAKLLYEWFQALALVKSNAATPQNTGSSVPSKITKHDVLRLPSLH